MLNMPESVAILKGHTGLVKGIAWDPIGILILLQIYFKQYTYSGFKLI